MTSSKIQLNLGKITMKNFRAYRGEVEIELSRDPKSTITVIEGNMGVGKTTILDSIYWCLYGEERGNDSRSSDEGIITNDVFEKMSVGDIGETSVEISLYEKDELRYKIRRAVEFTKNRESDKVRRNSTTGGSVPEGVTVVDALEYSELPKRSDNWIAVTDKDAARIRIENLFPKSLSSYFLFDAELLTNFFDSNIEKHVKNGIERISGLPILEDAMGDLNKTSDAIRTGIRDVNLDPKRDIVDHLVKTIERSKEDIERWERERSGIENEKESLESELWKYDEEQVQNMLKDRERLEKDLKSIKERLARLDKEMGTKLLFYNTMLRLNDSMGSSMKMCDGWEKEGRIPIAVSGRALRNILSKEPPECICGAVLEKGSPGRLRIEGHINKNLVESPVIQNISIGRGHWGNMIDEVMEIRGEITKLKADRTELDQAYDVAKAGLDAISEQLANSESADISAKSSKLKELKHEYNNLTGKIATSIQRLEKSKLEHMEKDREYKIELKKHEKFTSHSNRLALANKIGKILKQCRLELIDEMRGIVQKKTGIYFLRLVSRDDFSDVEIRPNYDVSALGHNGKSKRLSAGQSCCLAMSYIAAIRDISQRNYFMLIDSPLHNISQKERVEIAQRLPQFLPEMQITLLMQDQELKGAVGDSSSVKETLINSKSLWRHYVLKSQKKKDDIAASTTMEVVK